MSIAEAISVEADLFQLIEHERVLRIIDE